MGATKGTAKFSCASKPVHTYNDGKAYFPARGRAAVRQSIELRQPTPHSVISGRPTTEAFLRAVHQQLKIRKYASNSEKKYLCHLRGFLRWHGNRPHTITRQDVCDYLELLVDSGVSSSHLSGCLSAIRMAFDKLCGRDITLGLATPRRAKHQPVILSTEEVSRILGAAHTRIAKLALGILYAAGLRNSELCRLQVQHIDFDRNTIRIRQGKGASDRLVMLPQTFAPALQQLCHNQPGETWLFPALNGTNEPNGRTSRHMSPRTLQRWVANAVNFANVTKRVTPHSFRHAFATHLLESGTDIRFIQKLLGHQRLETTTIYTKLAQIRDQAVRSPLDQLNHPNSQKNVRPNPPGLSLPVSPPLTKSVGKLKIHLQRIARTDEAKVTLEILRNDSLGVTDRIFLLGIRVQRTHQNWIQLTLPDPETWQQPFKRLPREVVERIQSIEFYETIRNQISRRFQVLP